VIKLARPEIGAAEIDAVARVLETGMLVEGVNVAAFETAVGRYTGARHAIAVSSGTAALHLALVAVGVGPGDEVIVPGFTFPASANVIELAGAVPVLVDIDLATFNLDPAALERLVTPRTRAIMPVHLFGQSAEMDVVAAVARAHGLKVVEDAACALGARYRGRACGALSDAGCFSFHPRKVITTGEGGMVLTDDDAVAARIRALRNHGYYVDGGGFLEPGFNYRMTDFQGAVGVAQMSRLDGLVERRRELARLYDRVLADLDVVRPSAPPHVDPVWQAYVVLLPEQVDRAAVTDDLRARGVETTFGTYSLGAIPRFASHGAVPRSTEAWRRSLSLPLHPRMADEDVASVAEALAASLREVACQAPAVRG